MIKKVFFNFLFMTLGIFSFAQDIVIDYHDNIDNICHYVKMLHDNPENYEEVNELMKNDYSWMLMTDFYDNCINKDNICSIFDDVEYTGINDRAYQVEISRGDIPQTSDNFCTGIHAQTNYLFYESSIIKNSQITTSLTGRNGSQMFVIIPFNRESINVSISLNGNSIEPIINTYGHICFIINDNVNEDDNIEIIVSNVSDKNQSFVIINHNSVK